jgi:histidinol-phosphate aminotransferase
MTGVAASVGDGRIRRASANESPFPPLPGVLDAVADAARRLNRYPDVVPVRLIAAIARRFAVPEDHVAVGAGSSGLIQQLVHAFARGKDVLHGWRAFEGYPLISYATGANPIGVPLAGEDHDLDAIAAAVTERTGLIFLGSPNNPTGTVIGADDLVRLLGRLPDGVVVALDEAYGEFVRDRTAPDALALHREWPNLVVLRTFSKAYGLAGLRVGYAIGQPGVIGALRGTSMPFATTTVAEAAVLASLAAEDELRARCEAVVAARERMLAGLWQRGFSPPPSGANFVWLRLGAGSAAFAAACQEAGVEVKSFDGEGVRITVGDAAADEIVLDVAERFSPTRAAVAGA